MKNIHVLPTTPNDETAKGIWIKETRDWCNIYITSYEDIKEGDWYYLPRTNSVHMCIENPTELNLERIFGVAKIILTTDQDLIADGVQAIPDEFLEWFVKNPSCEFVGVKKEKIVLGEVSGTTYTDFKYKLIIPKEQQKQHLIDMMRSDEELGLYDEQETLEEVAENYINKQLFDFGDLTHVAEHQAKQAFKNGAKWQQQQNKNLYSKEDMWESYKASNTIFEDEIALRQEFEKWFNQFKKQ